MNSNSWDIPPPPGCDSDFEKSQETSQESDHASSSNRLHDPLVRGADFSYDRKIESLDRPKYRSKSRSIDRSHRRRRSRSRSRSRSRHSRKKRSRSRRRRHHSSSRSRSRSGSRDRRSRHKSRRHRRRSSSRSRSKSRSPSYRSKRSHKRDRERKRRSYTRSPSTEKLKPPEPPIEKPPEEEDEEDEEEEEPVKENAFKNDGSFLEMFKKMQEQQMQQQQEKQKQGQTSEIKKPLPMFGKRRGGKVLKTGLVQKAKTAEEEEEASLANQDAWSVYMKEVRRYKEACCDDDSKTRPLVK